MAIIHCNPLASVSLFKCLTPRPGRTHQQGFRTGVPRLPAHLGPSSRHLGHRNTTLLPTLLPTVEKGPQKCKDQLTPSSLEPSSGGGVLPQELTLPSEAGRGRGPHRRGSQESTEQPSTQLSPSSPTVEQGWQPQNPELPGWTLLRSCCLQSGHKLLSVKAERAMPNSGSWQ